MPETIRITIEMTEEEAHAYFFMTGEEHPGKLSMRRKLNGWAQQHPSIRAYVEARNQERLDSHESSVCRESYHNDLWQAVCICGWNSRAYKDWDRANEDKVKHVFKGQQEARKRRQRERTAEAARQAAEGAVGASGGTL